MVERFRSLIADPTFGTAARVALGQIFLEEFRDPRRALEACAPPAASGGSLPPALALLAGRCRCELGDAAGATALLEHLAEAAEPARSGAKLYLAWCALKTGNPSRAAALLEEVRGNHRGSGRYFSVKAAVLAELGDARAPTYREWEERITALEQEARELRREAARASWPAAAAPLLRLVENARRRRRTGEACRYALLATEADPASAAALRELLTCPLSDFVQLNLLLRLARIEKNDATVAARIAEIRTRYGIATPQTR